MNDYKCSFGDGIVIKPDGEHELDACKYEEIEKYANVTLSVMRCKRCGHTELWWERQENTEELECDRRG